MGIRDQRNQVYQNSTNRTTGEAQTASPKSSGSTSLRKERLELYNQQNNTTYKKASSTPSVFTPKTTEAKADKARKAKLDNYIREFQANGIDVDTAKKMAESVLVTETTKQNKKATEQYEKELKEIQSKAYKDNFFGQFGANYTLGDLTEEVNLATSEYLSNPTEENNLKAERAKALKDAFTKNSSAQEALDDENVKASILTKDLAGYLPQFKNQQVAGLKEAVPGAAAGAATGFALGNLTGVGAVLPEEILTVPGGALKGGKLGYTAGTTKYSYDTMRGAAYQQLIDAGVPEDIAVKAASDEAVVGAMVEAGSTLLGLKFLGFDKLGKAVIGTAGKEATSTATKKVLTALAGYGLNIPQEYLEEGTQEVVSIANEDRLKEGKDTGLLDLVGKSISKATNLSESEKERVQEAGEAGAKIAAMMGAAGATTANTLTYAVGKAQDTSVGRAIKASDMTNSIVTEALNSEDKKTKAKAEQVVKDLSSGKDVSNAQLGNLYKSVAKEQTVKAEAQAKATAEVQESSVVKPASTSDNELSKVFAQKQVENPTAKVATPTTEALMAQGVSTEKAVVAGDAITIAVEGGTITNKLTDTILGSSVAKAEFEAQTGIKLSSEKSKARKQIKEYANQVAQQKAVKAEATQAEVQRLAEQNAQQAKVVAEAQVQAEQQQQPMTGMSQENLMPYTEFARQMQASNPNATDMQIASAYQDYVDGGTTQAIDAQELRDFVERVAKDNPDMTPQQIAEAYQAYKASAESPKQEEVRSSISTEGTADTFKSKNADVEYVAKKATEALKKYGIEVKTYENPSNKKQKGYYKGKTIYLNASALKGRNAALYTLAHELMHPAIAKDTTLAKDFIAVCKKEGIITKDQIAEQISKARPLYEAQATEMGETDLSFITDEYLETEIVCNLASDVFGDIGLLERVVKQDLSFFARLMTSVKQVINGTKEASLKKDYQEIFNRMDKVLKADSGNLMTKDEDGRPNFHIETYELGGKELLNKWLDSQSSLDKQTKDEIREGMNKAYELATSLKGKYAVYDAWNDATVIEKDGKPVMSVIVKNGEYVLNIDFSTICKKRKNLDQVLNALVRTDGTAIAKATQEDIAEINRIIKEHDFEIACGLCFVDAKRYRIADWASSFTDMWNELAESAVEGTEAQLQTLKLLNKEAGVEGVGQDLKALREGTETDTDTEEAVEEYNWTLIDEKIADEDTKPLQRKMAEYMREHPEAVKHIDPQDLIASEGLDVLKAKHPEIYTLLNSHQGSAKPKLSHSETPYNYEVLQSAKMTKEEARAVGGVRIQSFSDYVATMFFDYVQLIGDLSAKELPAQAYTKEADFVKLFGMSGIKINMSLVPGVREISEADKAYLKSLVNEKGEIPADKKKQKRFQALAKNAGLDENGNYIWAKESFGEKGGEAGFQLAIELQRTEGYRENIGTIAVGVSDEHITKLLNDPDIRMVIPYHKSGINPAVALANNVVLFKDYTLYQNTRVKRGNKKAGVSLKFNSQGLAYTGDDKNNLVITKDGRTVPYFDFYKDLYKSGDAKKTAQNYLDYCDDYHIIPKFDAFRDNPNYYKLLIDFNTYDAVTEEYTPQKPVVLKLPEDFGDIVAQSLDKSQANADRFEAEKPAILDEVREKILYKYKETEDRELFSLSEEDQTYTEAVERGDMETAQRMVEEAAKRAGYTVKAYHGTPSKFTVFDKAKYGKANGTVLGNAFYFSSEKDVADEWGGRANTMSVFLKLKNPIKAEAPVTEDMLRAYEALPDKSTEELKEWYDSFMKKRYQTFEDYLAFYAENKKEIAKRDTANVEAWLGAMNVEGGKDTNSTDLLKKFGYDGVVKEHKRSGRIPAWTEYAVFDENQIKSAEAVTYDDEGKAIPLSERFNTEKEDIRFSLSEEDRLDDELLLEDFDPNTAVEQLSAQERSLFPWLEQSKSKELKEDSTGAALTPQQREYFKNSKVVDKQGRLLRMYHNTNADFTIFDIGKSGSNQGQSQGQGFYLTKSKELFNKDVYGSKQLEVYVNITRPFYASEQTLTEAEADYILEKYASKKHDLKSFDGLYAEHAKAKLLSPVRMMDYLMEYAKDNGIHTGDILQDLGYDGIIVGNGIEVVAFSSEQIKLVTNTAPTEDTDIRFSLSEDEAVKVDEFMKKYKATLKENELLKAKVNRAEDAKLNEMVKRILAEDKHKEELKATKTTLNKTFKAKEAHNAKKAELENAFAVDSVALGKDIGYERELRETKRQYQAKIAENNRKAREDKLQAIKAQREEMWARVAVENDKREDSDVAHLIHEKKAVAKEKQKSAEKQQKSKFKLNETRRLKSERGKKARNTLHRHQKKTSTVLEQSVENTYKQITGKDLNTAPKNVQEVWRDAKTAATSTAREARAIFVRGTQELDVFDRVQRATGLTDILPVTTAVKMVRAAGNTCEHIYGTALVNAEGDVIGKALKDVALCYDENSKFSQKDQNIFQMYLLAKHTVDRMSFKERAEKRVADFEASHPGLAEMSPEEFALLATQPKKAEGQYAYSRAVADEYIRLMEMAQKAKNKPVLKADDGTAVRADTAEKIAESLEAEHPWLKDKSQELYDWYDTFMQEWVVGTRLSQEQYDMLKSIYPHYVPTYRVKEYESGKVSFTGKQGVSVADVMKRAKGGLSEVMPIEDSFYNLINGYVKQHRDAELRNAMYDSIEQHPEEFAGLGVIETEIETEENLAEVDTTLDAPTLEEVKLEEVKDAIYRVSTWQNGEKKSMWVSKEIYDSLRSLDGSAGLLTDEFKEKTKAIRGYVSLRKTLITGINPFFGIRNVVRDLQSALIYTEGSPLHFSNAWFRAWREMSSKSENWQHFIALGGLYSTRTRVDGGFAKAFGKGDSTGVKALKKVPATMGKFNETSEAVTRFAEYLSTIDRLGDSYEARLQAIRNASEITLDFGEAGRWGRDINQYVMYWNAQMQGVDKFVRQVREKPAKTLSRATVLMSVPTIMCYALASFMDKEEEWDNIPSYVHDDYWVVFVGNEGDYIKVPKTREFGAIIAMPLTRLLLQADGVPDAWDNWTGTLKGNFLADEPVGSLPFVSTANDIRANKNYRDVPIVSSKFSNITAKEDFEKVYNEDTSIIAVKLGELFNIKPIQIDYVLKTEFGSMMAMALDAMSVGSTHNKSLVDTVKYTGEAAVKKLGIGNTTGSSRTISRFYDVVSETESNKTAVASEITDEDALHATPEWQINNAMSKYHTEVSALSKAKRELITQTMSKTERDKATAEINAQIEAVASEALDLYDDFKAGKIERPDLIYRYRRAGVQDDVMKALIDLDPYTEEEDVDFALTTLTSKSIKASDSTSRVTYDIEEHQGAYNEIFKGYYNEKLSERIHSEEYMRASETNKAKLLTEAKAVAKKEAEVAMAEYMKSQGVKARIKSGINIDSKLEEELIKVSRVYNSSRAYFPKESAPTKISHPSSKYSKTYEMVLTDEEKKEYMKIYESTYNKYMTQAINSNRYQALGTYNERRDYLYKLKGDIDDAVTDHYIKTLESRGRKYSKKQQ